MRPCPAYPAAGLPTFRVRLFLDILTSDFHVSTTGMLFDGFLWRKSYGKRELFLTKKNFVQVLGTHWSLIPSVLPLFGPPPAAPLLYEKSGTSQITISHSYAGFCCSFLRCWHNYPIVSSLCDFFVFSIVGFRAAASDVFRGYGREKFQDFTVQKYVRRKFCRNQLKFGTQVGYGVKHLFPGRTLLISSRFCFIDVCVVLI